VAKQSCNALIKENSGQSEGGESNRAHKTSGVQLFARLMTPIHRLRAGVMAVCFVVPVAFLRMLPAKISIALGGFCA
jgi:hypothetical protein